MVEVSLCSAHSKSIADKKKHAEFVLARVQELTADGRPLESALEWLQVSQKRYERLLKILE